MSRAMEIADELFAEGWRDRVLATMSIQAFARDVAMRLRNTDKISAARIIEEAAGLETKR